MGKRAKITALITTLCLCLSLFVMGVLAATSATLNVTSTLNFTADGVYIMVDASLKQGSSVTGATLSSGENITENTYKGYSYPRETNQDYPNGEASTTYFVNESGVQDNDWTIGQIDYSTESPVVIYEFIVSNYSPFAVSATINTNLSDIISASNGQLRAATYKDSVQDSTPMYSFEIPERANETTPETTTYQIVVTLENFMTSFTTDPIDMNISFEKPLQVNYEYFNIQNYVITGLTQQYTQDAPETLVIPGVAEDGLPLTITTNNSSSGGGGGNYMASSRKLGYGETIYNSEKKINVSVYDNEIIDNLQERAIFSNLVSSTIIINEGIINLPAETFYERTTIENVSLPSTLTTIGSAAFYGCTNLKNVNIPVNVESIGSLAFYNCKSLQNINIPQNVASIGENLLENAIGYTLFRQTFYGCENLQLTIDANNNYYTIYEGNLYNKDLTEFKEGINVIETLILPSSVTKIANGACYYCDTIVNLTIPSSVVEIGCEAFEGCVSLESVIFEDTEGWSVEPGVNTISQLPDIRPDFSTLDLSNSLLAATYLVEGFDYYGSHFWYKS